MRSKDLLPLTVGQFKKIWPHLHMAILRHSFQPFVDKLGLEFLLDSDLPLLKLAAAACTPPQNEAEEHLMLLSDLAAGLLLKNLSRKVEYLLARALAEVDEAYQAAKAAPGGFSGRRGKPESRREAVLIWFRENRDRLKVLEEKHLQDRKLYVDGTGQEKRDFQARLLRNIIETKYPSCEIPEININAWLKLNREGKKWLEKIMSGKAAP